MQGMGDIEDLPLQDGSVVQCISCPWHDFKLSLSDGHKYLHTDGPGASESPTSVPHWKRCDPFSNTPFVSLILLLWFTVKIPLWWYR